MRPFDPGHMNRDKLRFHGKSNIALFASCKLRGVIKQNYTRTKQRHSAPVRLHSRLITTRPRSFTEIFLVERKFYSRPTKNFRSTFLASQTSRSFPFFFFF